MPSDRPIPADLLAILACPGCPERRPLTVSEDGRALVCACGRYTFPVRDGIPILLVSEAVDRYAAANGAHAEAEP